MNFLQKGLDWNMEKKPLRIDIEDLPDDVENLSDDTEIIWSDHDELEEMMDDEFWNHVLAEKENAASQK